MHLSNWLSSLDIDLEQATQAIQELKPLLKQLSVASAAADESARLMREKLRDVSLTMSIAQQKQAEALNERFSNDEEIDQWLLRHQ